MNPYREDKTLIIIIIKKHSPVHLTRGTMYFDDGHTLAILLKYAPQNLRYE